jgi:hypothetical protein
VTGRGFGSVWRAIALAAAAAGLAAALRFLVIEPAHLAWACQVAEGEPWWCLPRQAVIVTLRVEALGWASVALGIFAFVRGGIPLAMGAVAAGGAGLMLYAAGPAALGLLLGLLRTVRRST